MALIRRLTVASVSCLIALATLTLLAGAASAEDGYRFWGYYHLTDAEWVSSNKGAASIEPEDGQVEGFHFAVAGATPTRPPRVDTSFDEICGATEADNGEKRVGIVIDYGSEQEAPEGEQPPAPEGVCAVVPEKFSTQQALDSVAELRLDDSGLLCGINEYPATGCGDAVKNADIPTDEPTVELQLSADAADDATDDTAGDTTGDADASAAAADDGDEASEDGFPWSLVVIAALVALLGGAAVALSRRRT